MSFVKRLQQLNTKVIDIAIITHNLFTRCRFAEFKPQIFSVCPQSSSKVPYT